MDLDKFWADCLTEIKKSIRDESYKTWFEPTRLVSATDSEFILHTKKGDIHARFLEDKYRDVIMRAVKKVSGKEYRIKIEAPSLLEKKLSFSQTWNKTLNKEYCFENFIVGQSNEFAHSAALAVSESPGTTRFNPLFIYGKSGLGKTHLLQAIGNFIAELSPEKKIIYTNSVQFMEQYIKYIEIKNTDEFNKIYKSCDALLIDDIQFLSGKQATQEIFFHIFNELFHNNKQIVITSDKYPKELDGLEERLISRFQSGLMVDIQPPNLETKIAILHKKAKRNNLNLPENVVEYIARNTSINIREMEGNLIKLLAYSSMYNVDI
ncbi:MAG: chromosomal replication initiator protein DnaA, partial [Fibrobacterota bacterium]